MMWDVILNAIATHQDTIINLFSGGGVVVVTGFLGWVGNRWLKKRELKRQQEFSQPKLPFELVKPNGDVFSLVYPPVSDYKNPVLADRNIPYQRRIYEKNTTEELYQLLCDYRWVLIMGRTGIGKTREAAEVAQRLNNEGWTVLKLKLGAWLDRPNNEQLQAIGTDRKLLFLLDDLHQFMRRSEEIEKHPEGKENLALPMNIPLQERLLDTLKAYENEVSDPQEIRVLAITRNEKEAYYAGQDSPYDKLQWDKYQKLWNQFFVYEMPDPEDGAIVELFQDIIPKTKIKKKTDYDKLAVSNDGTFRNVVENLVSLDNLNLALNKQNFKETLQGTWDKRYNKAIERDKLAEAIYDGIDLLKQCNVPLNELLVKETALLIVRGNRLQRLWIRLRLSKSLNRLILSYDKAIEFKPDLHEAWNNRGIALVNLGRLDEAIFSYDKAIEFKPDYHEAIFNKACAYALQNNVTLAVENLHHAINLDEKYREMAKSDSDFDGIRDDEQFKL